MLSAARRNYRHSWFCYSFVFRFDWNVYLRDMWLARNICMTMLFFLFCVACFGVCSTAGCCLSRQLASGWLSYMFCYFFFALGHDICVNAIPDGNVALPSLVFFNATSTSTRTRRGFFHTIKHSCLWSIITLITIANCIYLCCMLFCLSSCTCFRLCFALPMQQSFAVIAVPSVILAGCAQYVGVECGRCALLLARCAQRVWTHVILCFAFDGFVLGMHFVRGGRCWAPREVEGWVARCCFASCAVSCHSSLLLLEVGNVYTFSNGSVKIANKQCPIISRRCRNSGLTVNVCHSSCVSLPVFSCLACSISQHAAMVEHSSVAIKPGTTVSVIASRLSLTRPWVVQTLALTLTLSIPTDKVMPTALPVTLEGGYQACIPKCQL